MADDEPGVVKLLMQYFYEGEYEPKISDFESSAVTVAKRTPKKPVRGYLPPHMRGYTYTFPHSCYGEDCSAPNVCPHHTCPTDCRDIGSECYMYICSTCRPFVDPVSSPAQGDASQMLVHAKMYEMADKYNVIGLRDLAQEKFQRAATSHWDSDEFARAAHHAFTTTPEQDKGLRDAVSNIISQHMTLLKKPAVEALLNEFNGLAVGLLKVHGKKLGWV